MKNLENKKILFILPPNNFRDEEYLEPKKVLENRGAEVVTTANGVNRTIGMQGLEVKMDIKLKDIEVDDYDALVFVGGSGASVYFNDSKIHDLVKEAVKKHKVVSAICIAPAILANAGLLVGKRATAFPTQENTLLAKGANFTGEKVTRDGKIITASGPAAAAKFGEKIAEAL
jgi:protease I